MLVETEIEVSINYTEILGDSFDEDEDPRVVDSFVEQRLKDFCRERNIPRSAITVIGQSKFSEVIPNGGQIKNK